jgi:hypothetical protein
MENDMDVLDALFWPNDCTLRYGVDENLYGFAAITEFRKATANVEFQREGGGRPGRQSQTWLRTGDGWKIVAAHVSLMADSH